MINLKANKLLKSIADILVLNTSFMGSNGMVDGKLGASIFLLKYSEYTGNTYYQAWAEKLLEELFNRFRRSNGLSLSHGLIGIGWGLDYLAKHYNFEASEALDHLDEIISDSIFGPTKNTCTDLLSGALYFSTRLSCQSKNSYYNPTNNIFPQLNERLKNHKKNTLPLTPLEVNKLLFVLENVDTATNADRENIQEFLLQYFRNLDYDHYDILDLETHIYLIRQIIKHSNPEIWAEEVVEIIDMKREESIRVYDFDSTHLLGWYSLWFNLGPTFFYSSSFQNLRSQTLSIPQPQSFILDNKALINRGLAILNMINLTNLVKLEYEKN